MRITREPSPSTTEIKLENVKGATYRRSSNCQSRPTFDPIKSEHNIGLPSQHAFVGFVLQISGNYIMI